MDQFKRLLEIFMLPVTKGLKIRFGKRNSEHGKVSLNSSQPPWVTGAFVSWWALFHVLELLSPVIQVLNVTV